MKSLVLSGYVVACLALALTGCGASPNNTNQGGSFLGGTAGTAGTFGGAAGFGQAGASAEAGTGAAGEGPSGTGTGLGSEGNAAGTSAAAAGAAGGSSAGTAGSLAVDGGFPEGSAGAGGPGSDAGSGGAGGMGGSGGSSGAGAAGSGGTGGSSAPKNKCLSKGSQVILIGDSYINWGTHSFPSDLNTAAGQTFRDYAVGGYSMGSGGIGLIPPEFDQAYAADPDIVAVVMDGGGNDILIPSAVYPQGGDCKNSLSSPSIPDCQTIVKTAFDAATKLMDNAAAKGVRDVVYFFYPHVPEGTLIGGAHPNAILDYALPKAKELCDGAEQRTGGKLRCHFIDLIPVFDGHADWFAAGDIHENTTGSAAMAKKVWQTMKDLCIAQPSSSGCCAP